MPGGWSLQFGSEATPGEASKIDRVDVFLRLVHGGKHVANLAVLNIKDSRSVMKQAASLKAAVSPHANLLDALAKAEPTEPSRFCDISATYAQQATSYAAEYSCKYVAFFDWYSLFIFQFDAMADSPPGPLAPAAFAGHVCYGLFAKGDTLQQIEHAILGFFLKPIHEWINQGQHRGGPDTAS